MKFPSHLYHLVGFGKELPVTELPTPQDLLRYGLNIREIREFDKRNYYTDQLVSDTMEGLLGQWTIVRARFSEAVRNVHGKI